MIIFALIMPILFLESNKDFFKQVEKERNEGYTWHYVGAKPLDEPPVPSLPLQVEGEEPFVLWKLKKPE